MDSPPPDPGPSPADGSFDLSQVYVHLGLGARAETLPDFTWTQEYLRATRPTMKVTATRGAW